MKNVQKERKMVSKYKQRQFQLGRHLFYAFYICCFIALFFLKALVLEPEYFVTSFLLDYALDEVSTRTVIRDNRDNHLILIACPAHPFLPRYVSLMRAL